MVKPLNSGCLWENWDREWLERCTREPSDLTVVFPVFLWGLIYIGTYIYQNSFNGSPDQRGSVGWALSHKAKRSPVQFLVREHAWVLGPILSWFVCEKQRSEFLTPMFLSVSISLPCPLSKNKYIKYFKKKNPHSMVYLKFMYLIACILYY